METIAAFVCVWFVIHLLRHDAKDNPDASSALWVPLLWMFFAGSRYLSSWMNLSGPGSAASYDEGSPIDRAVFLALILVGLVILSKRDIDWMGLLFRNKLFVVYLLYCLVSTTWSDEPFISFKRWFKDLGNPIMALVILTDRKPLEAIGVIFRRLSYLLLPLSVLFLRYYPELGRDYHADGSPMYTGVGHQKNALGQMCLVTGIYFAWQVLQDRERYLSWTRSQRLRLWLLVCMLAWLLHMSNSQTSLSCLLAAIAVLASARLPLIRGDPSRVVGLFVFTGLAFFVLEASFDIKGQILELLGRDPSLTNRTELWAKLMELSTDPVIGSGFMSFWAGDRLALIWSRVGTSVLQAHSGYVEQYLNLGYVGVTFMLLLMGQGLFRARTLLRIDPSLGILRLSFVLAAALYNYTEASFYGINNMWVLVLLGMLNIPQRLSTSASDGVGSKRFPANASRNLSVRPKRITGTSSRAR
jgi:exopolysaccharide production protein ExoQ